MRLLAFQIILRDAITIVAALCHDLFHLASFQPAGQGKDCRFIIVRGSDFFERVLLGVDRIVNRPVMRGVTLSGSDDRRGQKNAGHAEVD